MKMLLDYSPWPAEVLWKRTGNPVHLQRTTRVGDSLITYQTDIVHLELISYCVDGELHCQYRAWDETSGTLYQTNAVNLQPTLNSVDSVMRNLGCE